MENLPSTIAIDGPAASGKSTIGKLLAERLGYLFFDTGALYRALTFLALEQGVSPYDEASLGAIAENAVIDIQPATGHEPDARPYSVTVGSRDITWQLRDPAIDAHVSAVAAHPRVRSALVEQQRRIGRRGHIVMVGRDIGTVVMPDADFKVYLDASVEMRARRRCEERRARGEPYDEAVVLADMRARDQRDSNRAVAPLRQAADAILVDATHLSIPEVVEQLVLLLQAPTPR